MSKREHVFDHPSQLNALSALPMHRMSGMGALKLGGTVASHPEREQWERELNRHYYACGCDASAAALIVALALGGAWAAYGYFKGSHGPGTGAGIALAIGIAGGVLGKLYGRVRANRQLKETVRRIQDQWKPDETPGAPHWTCG